MEARIHAITLGVSDLASSRKFYEAMGWKASSTSNEKYAVFHCKGALLALFPEKELAKDPQVDPSRTGFRGVTLAYNVVNKEDVAKVLSMAESAGTKIVKVAEDVFWGGQSDYFSDPDGHLTEVAWNPLWKFNPDGSINLPL